MKLSSHLSLVLTSVTLAVSSYSMDPPSNLHLKTGGRPHGDDFTALRLTMGNSNQYSGDKATNTCTAAAFAYGNLSYLITAKHCVDAFMGYKSYIQSSYPISSLRINGSIQLSDQQLYDPYFSRDLYVSALPQSFLGSGALYYFNAIRSEGLERGETIYFDGFPYGIGQTRAKCHFENLIMNPQGGGKSDALTMTGDWILYGVATCDVLDGTIIAPGESGGPVFDSKHRLVGIVNQVEFGDQNQRSNVHIHFAPLFQNTFTTFSKEFCGKGYRVARNPDFRPSIFQFDEFCSKAFPIFKPQQTVFKNMPVGSEHQNEVYYKPRGMDMPIVSYCRNPDLSTVRVLRNEAMPQEYLLIKGNAESEYAGTVEEKGTYSNFTLDKQNNTVKKFSRLEDANEAFEQSCKK